MRIKLFPKFLIFISLISIVPLAVIGFYAVNINREMLQTEIFEHYIKIATALSDKIHDQINNTDRRMGFITASQRQEYLSDFEQIGILKNIISASDDFIRASIINKSGEEIVASNPEFEKSPPPPRNYVNDVNFLKVKNTKKYHITPLYYDKERPTIDFYFPLVNTYILKICVSFENISDTVQDSRRGSTGNVFIVDENGRIIFHNEKERAINFENVSDEPIVKEAITSANIGSRIFVSKTGVEMIGAFAPVEKLGWNVIFQQTKNEAYSSIIKMRRNATVIILVALLFAIIVSFVLASSLSRPILNVIDVSKNVAKGDFTKKVKITTRDEMADLANNFNHMTGELSHYTKMQADKLSAIVYSINDGLVLTSENNKIVLMNDMASKILEIPKDSTAALFEIVENNELLSAIKQVSEKPDTVKEVDLSKDKPFFINVATQIITDPDKRTIVGIIFIFRDITGEKEIDKMKDDFFHGITHDLRNPLTSMLGFLKFLLEESVGPVNEKQKYFLDIINKSSKRLLGMINDILDVAKLEVGRMELSLTQFDIKNTVQRVCDSMSSKALEGKIELAGDVPSTIISADEGLIERVLINLVGNALRFTPREGKITIKTESLPASHFVQVSVVDTGEGIPTEYLDKIFDKFQQVGARSTGGTGIGLTITKYIVEAHLGNIKVESKLGEGSKFIFTIPKNLKKNEKGEVCV